MTVHTALTLEQQGLASYLRGNVKLIRKSAAFNRLHNIIHIHDDPAEYARKLHVFDIYGANINKIRNKYDKILKNSKLDSTSAEYENLRRNLYYGFDQEEQDWMEHFINENCTPEQIEEVQQLQKAIMQTEIFKIRVTQLKGQIEEQKAEERKQREYMKLLNRRLEIANELLKPNQGNANQLLKDYHLQLTDDAILQWPFIEEIVEAEERRIDNAKARQRERGQRVLTEEEQNRIHMVEKIFELERQKTEYEDEVKGLQQRVDKLLVLRSNISAFIREEPKRFGDIEKKLREFEDNVRAINRSIASIEKRSGGDKNAEKIRNLNVQKADFEGKMKRLIGVPNITVDDYINNHIRMLEKEEYKLERVTNIIEEEEEELKALTARLEYAAPLIIAEIQNLKENLRK